MKQVTGFLTEDGTFFDNKAAADLHEAEHLLDHSARYIGVDPEKLKDAINQLHEPVRRYLDAQDASAKERVEYVKHNSSPGPGPSSLDREDTGQSQATPSDLQHKPPSRG